ncbi:MAG: hypothetical protein RBR79_06315 [Bacteroidales bacterium]|jgi:hypothetical protein|nr:hypothetical protein [Bacteroidales bacterium]
MIKRVILFFLLCISFLNLYSQDYSIEHEYRKVGVFNPEWEMYGVLNPRKFEHITGYFREELANIIIDGVKKKNVKIYDKRKREMNFDTLINSLIEFEKKASGKIVPKDSILDYIIPYISEYEFEEFVNYNYKTLKLEKKVKAYSPIIIRYKDFLAKDIDTVKFNMFWIFPEETTTTSSNDFLIPDTILYLHLLKYPVLNPFTTSIFEKARSRHPSILRSNGSKFLSPKEIDDLFVEKSKVAVYNDETGLEEFKEVVTEIIPEDIKHLRVGEVWSIEPKSLLIKKEVKFIIPLLETDKGFRELGIRINE